MTSREMDKSRGMSQLSEILDALAYVPFVWYREDDDMVVTIGPFDLREANKFDWFRGAFMTTHVTRVTTNVAPEEMSPELTAEVAAIAAHNEERINRFKAEVSKLNAFIDTLDRDVVNGLEQLLEQHIPLGLRPEGLKLRVDQRALDMIDLPWDSEVAVYIRATFPEAKQDDSRDGRLTIPV